MATKQVPVLTEDRSHHVSFDRHQQLGKEEVYLTFATEWRGQPAVVQMAASRYRHSEGISDWQVWAADTRGANTPDGRRGSLLTETARSRLADQLKPLVREWLKSEAYEASRADAHFRAVRHMVGEARPYDNPMREVRKVLLDDVHMTIAQRDLLYRMAEAYEAFARLHNQTP